MLAHTARHAYRYEMGRAGQRGAVSTRAAVYGALGVVLLGVFALLGFWVAGESSRQAEMERGRAASDARRASAMASIQPAPTPPPEPKLTAELARSWTPQQRADRLRRDCSAGQACSLLTLDIVLESASAPTEKRELQRVQATHEVPLYARLRVIASDALKLEQETRGVERGTVACMARAQAAWKRVRAWKQEQESATMLQNVSALGVGISEMLSCVSCSSNADESCKEAAKDLQEAATVLKKQEQNERKKL